MATSDKSSSGASGKGASAAKKTAAKKTASAKTSASKKAAEMVAAAEKESAAKAAEAKEEAAAEVAAAKETVSSKASDSAAKVEDAVAASTSDAEADLAASLKDTEAEIAATTAKIKAAREELQAPSSDDAETEIAGPGGEFRGPEGDYTPNSESFAYAPPVQTRVAKYPGEASIGRVFAAEFFGAFVLVLAGLGIGMYNGVTQLGGLAVALGFGLGVVVSAYAFGWISGGHFNPAVTLGAALARRVRWARVPMYWLAQLVGSLAAGGLLWVFGRSFTGAEGVDATQLAAFRGGLFKSVANDFGANSTGSTVLQFPWVTALLAEIVITAVFILVILGSTAKKANNKFAPLAIGLTLAVGLMILMPITNGSMNPTRSLAAAVFAGGEQLKDVWLFIVGPLVGGALGGLLYPLFAGFGNPTEDDE